MAGKMFPGYSETLVLLYISLFVSVTGCNSEQTAIPAERQRSNASFVLGVLQSKTEKNSDCIPDTE
jgi:hypothetical protein